MLFRLFGAKEKIIIGGQEEVDLEGWNEHPDYMTCGHIHKRQQENVGFCLYLHFGGGIKVGYCLYAVSVLI